AGPAARGRAGGARRVDWEGPARERRPRPAGVEGFRDSARDTVKPDEIDVFGQVALAHYIHRFSAANGHVIAAFGITPGYMRAERRGLPPLGVPPPARGAAPAGGPGVVRPPARHLAT